MKDSVAARIIQASLRSNRSVALHTLLQLAEALISLHETEAANAVILGPLKFVSELSEGDLDSMVERWRQS